MDIGKEISSINRESKKYLESISALEFMDTAVLFSRDLSKLIDKQCLPVSILVGCLMGEVYRLNTESYNILLDDKLMKSFMSFKEYVNKKFMEKE